MTAGFKTLDQFSQDGSLFQLIAETKSFLGGILDSVDSVTLSFRSIDSDLVIAQAVVGVLALLIVGITVLPFGATQPSIQACQLNTDQKLLKTGGVVIVVMTSISAILFLEVLKLSEMLGGGY